MHGRCGELTVCLEAHRLYRNRLTCERGRSLSQSGQIPTVSRTCEADKKEFLKEPELLGSSAAVKGEREFMADDNALAEFRVPFCPFLLPAWLGMTTDR